MARAEGAEHAQLLVRASGEIGVTRLGRHREKTPVHPNQDRLPQAGAGGEQSCVVVTGGGRRLERNEVVRIQRIDSIPGRDEIVDQMDALQPQRLLEGGDLHRPGQVGDVDGAVHDRSGDSKA